MRDTQLGRWIKNGKKGNVKENLCAEKPQKQLTRRLTGPHQLRAHGVIGKELLFLPAGQGPSQNVSPVPPPRPNGPPPLPHRSWHEPPHSNLLTFKPSQGW